MEGFIKTFRMALHVTLVISSLLLATQSLWVEPLTNYIVEHFYVLPVVEPSVRP